MRERPGWIPGFNDIISLNAPKMSSKMSHLNNLLMPNTYHPGLHRTSEGLQVFSDKLRIYVSNRGDEASLQPREVLKWIDAVEQHEQWNAKDSSRPPYGKALQRRVKMIICSQSHAFLPLFFPTPTYIRSRSPST